MRILSVSGESWWRSLIFLSWMAALAALLPARRFTLFLRPEFGVLLVVSILALLGFVVSGLIHGRPRPLNPPRIVRGGILLLPLAYLLNVRGAGLDSYAFENRAIGGPAVGIDASSAAGKAADKAIKSEPPAPSRSRSAEIEEATLLRIYTDPGQYAGKRVSVEGMVHHNDKLQQIFGEQGLVVFRFSINCCAADAMPLAVVVLGAGLPPFPEDAWVKVRGRLELSENKNEEAGSIPVLRQAVMEEIPAPLSPYLY